MLVFNALTLHYIKFRRNYNCIFTILIKVKKLNKIHVLVFYSAVARQGLKGRSPLP
jgi:hypothetical protein